MTMVTPTRSDTERAHRQLALQAFASLSAPQSALDAAIYAQDVRFHGPASSIWGPRAGQGEAMSMFANPCLGISRMDMQDDRVLPRRRAPVHWRLAASSAHQCGPTPRAAAAPSGTPKR